MSIPEEFHTISSEEALRRVQTEGWCVIDGVIPQNSVNEVKDNLIAVLAGRSSVSGVITEDQSFVPFLLDERLSAISEGLFGDGYRIARTDVISAGSDYIGTGWHADWPFSGEGSYQVAAPYGDLSMALSTTWMLTDPSVATEGTLIVSGSHRTDGNPAGSGDADGDGYGVGDRVASQMLPEVPAGSVLAFDSRLWHRHTSANEVISAGVDNVGQRLWLDIQYVPWWLDVSSMIPGLADYETRAEGLGYRPVELGLLDDAVFMDLPDSVKVLFDHLRIGQEVIPWHPDAPI